MMRTTLPAAALMLSVGIAGAHDFWLVPDAFQVAAGHQLVVRGQTSSSFPDSLSAVTADRVTRARVIGASDEETITAFAVQGQSLALMHRPARPGQKIIAAALGWREVKETAASFRNYLVGEGAEDALKRYEREGRLPTSDIIRRYAKYAKTVVEVGEGARAFSQAAGHPLEFIPLADPSAAAASGSLRFQLMFQGRPLAGTRVHAGAAVPGRKDTDFKTADDGTFDVALPVAGTWNVRTIHVVPSPPGLAASWDVHWATFVFQVR